MGRLKRARLAWELGNMLQCAADAHRKRSPWPTKVRAVSDLSNATASLVMTGLSGGSLQRHAMALEVAAIAVRILEGDV